MVTAKGPMPKALYASVPTVELSTQSEKANNALSNFLIPSMSSSAKSFRSRDPFMIDDSRPHDLLSS